MNIELLLDFILVQANHFPFHQCSCPIAEKYRKLPNNAPIIALHDVLGASTSRAKELLAQVDAAVAQLEALQRDIHHTKVALNAVCELSEQQATGTEEAQ